MKKAMPSSSSKQTDGNYLEGAIIRVFMADFLTYDDCEVKPGPYLNLLIGPNTSGKSSIVCAICLGLAGKTSFLGRAQQPSEFIKHGTAKAVIEITLYNPSGDHYLIRREISRPNRSDWQINGKAATQKSVEELVLKLNIQMGNLCQFLPQDKVADFAKMTQQELLENTEKAAGPIGMYENHQKLKVARERSRSLENSLKSTSDVLEREKQKNARLETDVKNFQERQKHLDKIKILTMKRSWVDYESRRKLYQVAKKKKDTLCERVREARQQNAPLQHSLDAAAKNIHELYAEVRKKGEVVKSHAQSASNKSKAIDRESDLTQEVHDDLNARRLQESKRKKTLVELRQHLKTLQEDLARVVETEDVQGHIEICVNEIKQTNQEMNAKSNRGETIKGESNAMRRDINGTQMQLKKLQDLSNQRLDLLRHKHRPTYDAVMWLRENKGRFKKTIHEPLMLIINVHEPRWAKYVEGHISFNDMKAFVCEDNEDMKAFLKAIRDEQGLTVNAVMAPNMDPSEFKPAIDIQNIACFGFENYLRDLFDCPSGAMAYLCKLYSVHDVPIGNRYTKENMERITLQVPQLRRFYTENHSYIVKQSRYGGNISTRCTQIKNAQLLTVILDDQREKQLKRDLQERTAQLQILEQEYRTIQAAHRVLETRMNELRATKKTLYEKKDLRQSLTQKIKIKQQSIARLESETIDLKKETAECQLVIEKINKRKMKLMKELRDNTKICQEASFEKICKSIKHAVTTYQHKALENEVHELTHNLIALERELDAAKSELKEVKDSARHLLTMAHKATGTRQGEELSPEMTQAFLPLPITVEGIDAAIHQEKARAECTYNTDEQVVEDYNRRKKEISRHQVDLGQREEALMRHQTETEDIKTEWIVPVQELIGRIDKNFSKFFSAINCTGEVDLNIPENPEDYEKYGMRIKVKYRDTEQLRELTPHHQSGGERSVATVLYMMALQELTKCPFRCVDEINQGMDPQNERKVFELVVQTACRKDTSQYFLLTPKLLPDLEYGDTMTVMCVNNGPGMMKHTDWALHKFLRRRNRMEVAPN